MIREIIRKTGTFLNTSHELMYASCLWVATFYFPYFFK